MHIRVGLNKITTEQFGISTFRDILIVGYRKKQNVGSVPHIPKEFQETRSLYVPVLVISQLCRWLRQVVFLDVFRDT